MEEKLVEGDRVYASPIVFVAIGEGADEDVPKMFMDKRRRSGGLVCARGREAGPLSSMTMLLSEEEAEYGDGELAKGGEPVKYAE